MKNRNLNKSFLIISGGEPGKSGVYKTFARSSDFVICADGGFANAKKLGIKPDLIIGDLDSKAISKTDTNKFKNKIKKYPRDKDESDTELAVRYAFRNGAKEVTILGALGKRVDHSLANIYVAGLYPGRVLIIDEWCELSVYDRSFSIKGKRGDTASILPFFSTVRKVTGIGFKYPVKNLTFMAGSLGISNELTGKEAKVNFSKGKLLLIKVKKG
jgi:thiamine pyrophosphokinase